MGDSYIKLSTTLALNRIRKNEELDKGWRKNEIQLPAELRDLNPVHVVPLADLGRLLLILVTRSVVLSNTLYSLLLEAEGKFFTLGSEWIGSLVKYEEKSVCLSKLFATNDPSYTDQGGVINDECEYFGNGIINDERFFLQSYVFDALFEIEFDFEKIEIEFVQQKAQQKIHVTSNPFFAFHDDVFPGFSKNAAPQPRFPRPSFYHKTIVPDNFFTSLEELAHISTVEMELNGKEKFQLEIEVGTRFFLKDTKFLECNFFDENTLLRVGLSKNGSFWIESDFFDKFFVQRSKKSLDFVFYFRSKSFFVELFQKKGNKKEAHSKVIETGLERVESRKLRIFKFDRETKIKNFILKSRFDPQINVILPDSDGFHKPYALKPEGSKKEEIFISSPFDSLSISYYVYHSRHALINGRLHIFGGLISRQKIARLDGCRFVELSSRLLYDFRYGHSAVTIEKGSKAMICFDFLDRNKCQLFDELTVKQKDKTNMIHRSGELALYNGRLIAIGGGDATGVVEELTENGWRVLSHLSHPRWISYFSAIGLPSGTLLTIGGIDERDFKYPNFEALNEIWELKNGKWSKVGSLSKTVYQLSAIFLDSSVFVFPGLVDAGYPIIHKIDLDSADKIIETQVIAKQEERQILNAIIFVTPVNQCSKY